MPRSCGFVHCADSPHAILRWGCRQKPYQLGAPGKTSASPSVDFPIAKYIPDVAVPQQHSGELQHEPLGGRNHVKIDPDQVRAASPSSLGTQTALHLLPGAVTASRRLTVSRRSSLSRLSSMFLAMLDTAIMSQSWPSARMSRAS